MNGRFTIEEAKHLSSTEYEHYAGFGLIDFPRDTDQNRNFVRMRELEGELRAKEAEYIDATGEVANLNEKLEEARSDNANLQTENLKLSEECDDKENALANSQAEIRELEARLVRLTHAVRSPE